MQQSLRVACFTTAFALFLFSTYLAFFRAHFAAPNATRSGILSLSWWQRPVEFNAGSRVHHVDEGVDFTCISALVGGGHIWVGGSQGLLIHSADDGRTWEQLPVVQASPVPVEHLQPSPAPGRMSRSRASLSDENQIRRVSWLSNVLNGKGPLDSNHPPTPSAAPANKPSPPVNLKVVPKPTEQPALASPTPSATPPPTDAPALPPLMQSLQSNTLIDLQFVTASLGYAVTQASEIISTKDGGHTWRLLRPLDPAFGFPVRVRFADERRGVQVGQFGVSSTGDGGETWSSPSAAESLVADVVLTDGLAGYAVGLFANIVQIVGGDGGVLVGRRSAVVGLRTEREQFTRIAKAGTQTLFACSSQGVVARRGSDEQWQALNTGRDAYLTGLFFSSDRVGWVIGQNGLIISTRDRGEHWEQQTSGTPVELRDVYFASENRGFAAGKSGTLIGTEDGGHTWQPLVSSSASAGGRHAWLPPPWYFATLLLLFGLVRRIPEETSPPPRAGISEILMSDKPLGSSDPDYLGFREVAWGLSNYLRNKATKPPLTVAITGEWGMGKSSLMNLLQSDLIHYKFRPVWFNAWHHQTEEHLLAALLENIRTQAIPSLATPEGVVFRTKLLWLRARRNLLATLLLVGAVCFAASFFATGHSLGYSATLLRDWLLTDKLGAELSTRLPKAGKALVALASAVFALTTFLKGFRPFGLNPASLLASRSHSATASALRAQTSFRHKFASEFREVTESLNPLTMVLFVDDLDRCRPEQVYDMLESINFLVSCGDCFVIMGLARRRVERCVGLVFEKVAAETANVVDGRTLDDAEKRRRFARQYLEKLVNIEVPVPKGEPDQIRTLLINKPVETPPPGRWENICEKLSRLLPHILPVALCLVVAFLAVWCSMQFFRLELSPAPPRDSAPSTKVPAQANATSAPAPAVPANESPQRETTPQIGAAHFVPGQAGSAPLWAIILLSLALLTPGIVRLSRRSGSVIEDSPAFLKALERWFPILTVGAEMTPRGVKRFVNRVRYLAMMEGSFQPAPRWWAKLGKLLHGTADGAAPDTAKGTEEDLLVALATIHERHPEWFAGNLASFRAELAKFFQVQPSAAGDSQELLRVNASVYEHFQKLVAGVEVR